MTTQLPALDRGPVALQRLREQYEREVDRVLSSVAGDGARVALVVAPRLAALLAHVSVHGLATLTRSNVAECVELTDDVAKITCDTAVYFSFASVGAVRDVAVHAAALLAQRTQTAPGARRVRLHIYVMGKWTTMCDQVLESFGLKEHFQIGTLPIGFVPLDTDVLTLGHDHCLYDCAIGGDRSCLVDAAMALDTLQRTYGRFEQIKYKGELSMLVLNHLVELSATSSRLSSELPRNQDDDNKASRLNTLIILDRTVDCASVLSTPLTYEALLDEVIGIHCGFLSPAARGSGNGGAGTAPVGLNSSDDVFSEIRSMNIHTVPPSLNARATAVKDSFSTFQQNSQSASAEEIQAFVKEVPKMKGTQQLLELHINLMEQIENTTASKPFQDLWQLERAIMDDADNVLDDICEMIMRHDSLVKVLRAVCLYSAVNDGLDRKDLERVKLHLVRAYGHELMFSFDNLDRLGLLRDRSTAAEATTSSSDSVFRQIASLLDVIDIDVDINNPRTAAFVTGGYMPVSSRLVEEILKNGDWRRIDRAMELLPGPRAEVRLAGDAAADSKRKLKKRVIVVFFVGGVTHVEIAALRWMASLCEYCACTFLSFAFLRVMSRH